MKYPTIADASGRGVSQRAITNLIRRISAVNKEVEPELFTHVQPHAHATAQIARQFAAACGAGDRNSGPTLAEIELGAHLHDIGKYFIPSSVLLKPAALDEDERAIVSLHPVYGAKLISKLPGNTDVIRGSVLHHHEHWNGSGYPEGLSGSVIPLAARVIAVVDVYTSLRSKRSYKPVLRKDEAFGVLTEMAGAELDPRLVEDFLLVVRDKKSPVRSTRVFASTAEISFKHPCALRH